MGSCRHHPRPSALRPSGLQAAIRVRATKGKPSSPAHFAAQNLRVRRYRWLLERSDQELSSELCLAIAPQKRTIPDGRDLEEGPIHKTIGQRPTKRRSVLIRRL